jgi:hypothetical protein
MTTGEIAYNAYCQKRGWKSVRGEPLPEFTAQSAELQAAWQAAADAVAAHIEKESNKELLNMAWNLIGGKKGGK